MFTAEMAAGLPALLLLLGVGVTAVSAVHTRLACLHAARDHALALARGASADPGGPRPPHAEITVGHEGGRVVVRVRAPVKPLGALPAMRVSAQAVAAAEPGLPSRGPGMGGAGTARVAESVAKSSESGR